MNTRTFLPAGNPRKRAAAALTGCVLLGTALTGCGSASANPGSAGQGPAGAFAEKILGELRLPAGAHPAPASGLPGTARDPWAGEPGATDRDRTWTVPVSLAATQTYLLTHGPAGSAAATSGREQGPHGIISESVYFDIRKVPSGITGAELQLYLIPRGPATTLIAAYAHVAARQAAKTSAEHLAPASYRAITISANGNAPSTFTSTAVISSLIAAINKLQADTNSGATSCPGSATDYRITFEPRSAASTTVTVDTFSCDYDDITAYGVPQPALEDRDNTIAALASHLTRIPQYG
jgi:hypothetical protein